MSEHNDFGKQCEDKAVAWLIENGFRILHRNWRFSHYEIDVVARKDDMLHFIEVKSRKSGKYGYPEDSVGRKKFKDLQRAADAFLNMFPGNKWIEYDILSITGEDSKEEYFFIKDVYLR